MSRILIFVMDWARGGSKLLTWARELHLVTHCGMIWTFLGLKNICNFVRNVNCGRWGTNSGQESELLRWTGPAHSKLPIWVRELHLATCCGMTWTFLGFQQSCNFVRNVSFGVGGKFPCQDSGSL